MQKMKLGPKLKLIINNDYFTIKRVENYFKEQMEWNVSGIE
jgi:hypothetical protein